MPLPFQPVPGAASLVVRGTNSNGKPLNNVFHFSLTVTLTQAVADIYSGIMAGYYGNIMGATIDTVQYDDCVVTDLRTDGAPQFVSTSGFPLVGLDSGDELPEQLAALISWNTAFRGRSGRGRTYFGGFDEADNTAGQVDTGLLASLASFAGDLMADAPAWGIVSRYHGGARRVNGLFQPITGFHIGTIWATQRRRGLRP